MFKLNSNTNYLKYNDVPEYHLYFHKNKSNNKSLILYKFSIKFIYYDLKCASVYVPFKYEKSLITLCTEEIYNCD